MRVALASVARYSGFLTPLVSYYIYSNNDNPNINTCSVFIGYSAQVF
jgi:hypothetical protein